MSVVNNSNLNQNQMLNSKLMDLLSTIDKSKIEQVSRIVDKMSSLNSGSENSDFNLGNLDPKLFSKIQQIVISIGKKDPKKDLLISLKPFLRKSRQDKISEYITILTIIKAFEAFNDKGSDKNV
mgnify:CR=1 FL=1